MSAYIAKSNTVLPDRYVVSVYGLDKQPWEKDFKAVHAVVDVARKDGAVAFTLVCFTLDSLKDECEK